MSGEALYTLHAEYTPQRFWDAAKRLKRGTFIGMRVFFAAVSVIGLISFLLLLLQASAAGDVGQIGIAGIISAAVTVFAGYKLFTFERSLKRRFIATVRRPQGEREIRLYDAYFECVGADEERRVEYTALQAVFETERGLCIQSRASVDFIDRAGCDPEEFERVNRFLNEKLNVKN